MVVKQEVIPVRQLAECDRAVLQALYERHYGGPHQFERDLTLKDWVLLLRQDDQVVGFSSLQRREHSDFVVYFSGDTLVIPGHRHGYDLPRLWGRFVFERVDQEKQPCLWLLLCAGFRTYRFLPVFFQRFYPRFDQPTPPEVQTMLDALARERYGELYHEGRVALTSASLEELPERRLDQHANFFLEKNPDWKTGVELVCLTWLERANLTPAGQRMLR
ncbi:hypothetical protein JST97_15300 [bacterium]|nr:hypothetical protein [bacterium]